MNSLDRSVSRTLRGLAAGLGLGACIATLRGVESTQTAVAPGRAAAQSATRVGQWEPFELSMTANHDFANAYVETLPDDGKTYAQVTFAGTSGEAKGLSSSPAFGMAARTGRLVLHLPLRVSGRTHRRRVMPAFKVSRAVSSAPVGRRKRKPPTPLTTALSAS